MKKCTSCNNIKELSDFYISKGNVYSKCKICYKKTYKVYKNYDKIVDLDGEIWKEIAGFEGIYEVSNMGRVKSINYNHSGCENLLKLYIRKNGYVFVGIYNNKTNKVYNFLVHRLVAQAFIPNPENKPEVNHKKGIKTDNRVSQLEWNTSKENIFHGKETGLIKKMKGIDNIFSKLKEHQVIEIRKIGNLKSLNELSKTYNVSPENISMILKRKTWKHI